MSTEEAQWHRSIPGELIHSNEVHVWRLSLDLTAVQMRSLIGNLSSDEVERAARFRFERDQKRFVSSWVATWERIRINFGLSIHLTVNLYLQLTVVLIPCVLTCRTPTHSRCMLLPAAGI